MDEKARLSKEDRAFIYSRFQSVCKPQQDIGFLLGHPALRPRPYHLQASTKVTHCLRVPRYSNGQYLYVRLLFAFVYIGIVIANIATCPHAPCLGVVVIGYHPEDKKRFDNKTRIWTFICKGCGEEFSATLDQIRTESVTEEWIDQQYPNRPKPRFS